MAIHETGDVLNLAWYFLRPQNKKQQRLNIRQGRLRKKNASKQWLSEDTHLGPPGDSLHIGSLRNLHSSFSHIQEPSNNQVFGYLLLCLCHHHKWNHSGSSAMRLARNSPDWTRRVHFRCQEQKFMTSAALCSLAQPADVPSLLLSWNLSGRGKPNDAGLNKMNK